MPYSTGTANSSYTATRISSSDKPTGTPCAGNTAADRSQWCDFSIDTDWYEEAPNTGVTKEYWIEITNMTIGPDGYSRVALGINNTIPGPLLEANWGDTVKIHVLNSLESNGTTIHWHGLRQNYTVQEDGVPSVVQCPDAPGTTHTYTWRATQYGTSWYHSHVALQSWNGVYGPLVIHGPATANYDEELEPIMLSDWSHQTADALANKAAALGPPRLDTGLINGHGTLNGTGSRYQTSMEAGKKYRMRLINGAIDTHFKVSLDNHTMTVIAMDFVPVKPFQIDVLDINMGQRYDVIIEANQAPTDYWFRAIPQASCSNNGNADDIRAIVRYSPSSTADPKSVSWPGNAKDRCMDVAYESLVPHVPHTVVSPIKGDTELAVGLAKTDGLFTWNIALSSMHVSWEMPSLLSIAEGKTDFETNDNVYLLPNANEWIYWVIDTAIPVPHPIHLHGHDFYVLAQAESATWNASVPLNLNNPPRRDVATLPASGYLVIAFLTDNPGAWLMHCHIGWHVAEGLALQFIERQSEIKATLDIDQLSSTCKTWDEYKGVGKVQDDSGV
ncbi:multicopper oxidase [Dothidotthia symphoricarpi CBS 119687]|uniref:Multicopper oxidase n=1 Tax=Dothidotthia symphoricarpi CBS 119687 TaxID=1392245 RepID=A0A6A6ATJ5_9PLEO|nr:multicopper oxidase [Dothidotthia symphoricarpi CBS 119687]KAF2134508.1 multicopper oxidase [Dothidotthia symphoricarpi CBS 119687]